MSIVQVVVVIVLAAYAGSVAGSAQFAELAEPKPVDSTKPGQ
jgi:hypothetical protein